jgi:hypothetical protein
MPIDASFAIRETGNATFRIFGERAMRLIAMGFFVLAMTFTGQVSGNLPVPQDRSYAIFRDGSEIGSRELRFSTDGGDLLVDINTSIKIKVAFITVFKRLERQREVWRNGELIEFASTVDDDGDDFRVEAVRKADGLEVTGSVGTYLAPAGTLPATYWSKDIVDTNTLINVKRGTLQHVDTSFIGDEAIKVDGAQVPTSRFKMTGDENLDLWYDENGTAVRVIFLAEDGSKIEFQSNGTL